MNNLIDVLQQLGMSEKESQIYLTCLGLGKSTATVIAKKAGIKRPTTYAVLESLVNKGLVSLRQTLKVTYYKAVHPKVLITKIQDKVKLADSILQEMITIQRQDNSNPGTEVFYGKNGVRTVYSEIIQYAKTGKEVPSYGSVEYLKGMQDLMQDAIHIMKNKKHKVRHLVYSDTSYEKMHIKQLLDVNDLNKNCRLRILPKQKTKVQNDNIIFGNKVAIFSTIGELFVLVIDSKEIADSYRAVFDIMWDGAIGV